MELQNDNGNFKDSFEWLAAQLSPLTGGVEVRFIEVDVQASSSVVESPTLRETSEVVELALQIAEQLIRTSSPVNAVHRAHTAFHGYLKQVARTANLDADFDSITSLFAAIHRNHPVFREDQAQDDPVRKALYAMATIVGAMEPIRNSKSLAHPNDELIRAPEAMLGIHTVRSLLHYLNSKIGEPPT